MNKITINLAMIFMAAWMGPASALAPQTPASAPLANKKPPLVRAFDHLRAQEYEAARAIITPMAQAGHRDARHMLGFMEERGYGGPVDLRRAIALYAEAASAGSQDAQFALGELALLGEGVERDFERAAGWFKLAAAQGHIEAQVRLAVMYAEGIGVEKSLDEATRLFRRAGEAGDAGAQYNLGVSYLIGRGVPKNYDKAAMWFEKAAQQNHPDAQYNLALLFDSDLLGPPAPDKTKQWMMAAAGNGLPAAYVAVGLMTHDGRVSAPDSDAAARSAADWFERAARAGDPQGQFLYAVSLAEGDGRRKDESGALAWLQLALSAKGALEPATQANAEGLHKRLTKKGVVALELEPLSPAHPDSPPRSDPAPLRH